MLAAEKMLGIRCVAITANLRVAAAVTERGINFFVPTVAQDHLEWERCGEVISVGVFFFGTAASGLHTASFE